MVEISFNSTEEYRKVNYDKKKRINKKQNIFRKFLVVISFSN